LLDKQFSQYRPLFSLSKESLNKMIRDKASYEEYLKIVTDIDNFLSKVDLIERSVKKCSGDINLDKTKIPSPLRDLKDLFKAFRKEIKFPTSRAN
jgi:hypothetical protein